MPNARPLGFQELVELLCREHETLAKENLALRSRLDRCFESQEVLSEGASETSVAHRTPSVLFAEAAAPDAGESLRGSVGPQYAQDVLEDYWQAPHAPGRLSESMDSSFSDRRPQGPRRPMSLFRADSVDPLNNSLRTNTQGSPQSTNGGVFSWVKVRSKLAKLSSASTSSEFSPAVLAFPKGSGQKYVINPERSSFLEFWDMATMTALAFVALVAPVQVAMFEAKVDGLFVLNCCLDLLFVVDLALQFFIMYPKKTNYGYALEHDQRNIARHYLKTWFVVDFLSIIPFDLIGLLSQSEEMKKLKGFKGIRLLRLLKLLRVLKASRLFRRFELRMSITYGTFALVKFFCILLIITHWLANLWALTLVLVEPDEGVARWTDKIDAREANYDAKTSTTPWKLYLTCLYFTSYTITSVGYGDITPVNIVEIAVGTLIIVMSGISWAVVLGQVCGTIANLNKDEQAFRSIMDELNVMMSDRVMPPEMRRRLRSFFLSNKLAQRRARHQRVVDAMSPGLRGEVVMEMNRMWIQKVSILDSLLREAELSAYGSYFYALIVDISIGLRTAFHAQSEVFGAVQSLYILSRGLVSRSRRLHSSGSVWGQDFMLSNLKLIEPFECWALTYVEVMSLQRGSFFQMVEEHKHMCPGLKRKVRWYVCWLATQRAILREAKRRNAKGTEIVEQTARGPITEI